MCNNIINIDCEHVLIKDNKIVQEDFVYVYILQLNDSNPISQSLIIKSQEDEIVFTIGEDGFYTLCKIRIPRDQTKPVYYYNSKFYFNKEEVGLQELVELNPNVTKLEIDYTYFFQICKLKKCYTNIAQKIIDSSTSCNNTVQSDSIYKRDLLWSTINVLQYLVEQQQYEEAQRLLKRVTGCNGLCDNCYSNNQDCGCGH